MIPPAQVNQTELAVRGGPSVPLILMTATTRPGTVTVGGAVDVPRTLPVQTPGNEPKAVEIETPTLNVVLPSPGTGTVLTGAL